MKEKRKGTEKGTSLGERGSGDTVIIHNNWGPRDLNKKQWNEWGERTD